ncbi:MAG: hypothetical protein ABFQ62_02505 [Patescibacteria group bacterium]
MPYVITCGDDGVQVNVGTRLGVVGVGLEFDSFSIILKAMKKTFQDDLRVVASGENDWVKEKFKLDDYGQADATMQQQAEAMSDKEGLLYSGFFPFADPKQLKHDIKGHMVRPKNVHIANKISFTMGGGEQTYSLGHYVISADWLHKAPKKEIKKAIMDQVNFYQKLAGKTKLQFVFELGGELDEKIAAKNKKLLEGIGIKESE